MNTQVRARSRPLWALGLAALFVSLAGTDAFSAAPTDSTTHSVKVQYNPRDLATEEGTQKVYRKIKNAARRVCNASTEVWDARRTRNYWRCYETALAKAVDDVNSKNLTALHQQGSNKHKRPG
jgi:UrcA family protein